MKHLALLAFALLSGCASTQTKNERIVDATARIAGAAAVSASGLTLVGIGIVGTYEEPIARYLVLGAGATWLVGGAAFGYFGRDELLSALNEKDPVVPELKGNTAAPPVTSTDESSAD